MSSITQNYNTAVASPKAPVKTGCTFSGWYTNAACTNAYTFTTMPAENVTLYAKWSINGYTISFNTLGGSKVAPITQDYNTTVTKPADPKKTGYIFGGWYTDAACQNAYVFSTMPAKNVTLYAKWTKNPLTLVANATGMTLVSYTGTEENLVLPDEITCIGDRAFHGNTTLRSITIPNSVTSIGDEAFRNCTRLTAITIPASVKSIGDGAFSGCYKLVEVINHSSLSITKGSRDYGYVAYYAVEVHKGASAIVNQDGYLFCAAGGVNYLLGYTGGRYDPCLA